MTQNFEDINYKMPQPSDGVRDEENFFNLALRIIKITDKEFIESYNGTRCGAIYLAKRNNLSVISSVDCKHIKCSECLFSGAGSVKLRGLIDKLGVGGCDGTV